MFISTYGPSKLSWPHLSCLGYRCWAIWAVHGSELVGLVSLLIVDEKEGVVVALHLSIGSLKTRSEFEPITRCELSSY